MANLAYIANPLAAARVQIRAITRQQQMVFHIQGAAVAAAALRPVILASLQQIFNPPAGGGAGGHIVLGHTNVTNYQSGAVGGQTAYLFNNEAPQIIDAYSELNIQSKQGLFEIGNGSTFYHTEPKALRYLLRSIDLPGGRPNVTDALLITRRPMCPCCARLLLSILNNREQAMPFPQNIIVMSRREFEANWRPAITAGAHDPAILASVDNIIGTAAVGANHRPENAARNELALLIRY
ncbi:MAG: hypothetical protein K2Q34_07325 [Alphaproteobacteria bacterium]|nr:hypothetical protein [Alphaproteobacteria bacterium]